MYRVLGTSLPSPCRTRFRVSSLTTGPRIDLSFHYHPPLPDHVHQEGSTRLDILNWDSPYARSDTKHPSVLGPVSNPLSPFPRTRDAGGRMDPGVLNPLFTGRKPYESSLESIPLRLLTRPLSSRVGRGGVVGEGYRDLDRGEGVRSGPVGDHRVGRFLDTSPSRCGTRGGGGVGVTPGGPQPL